MLLSISLLRRKSGVNGNTIMVIPKIPDKYVWGILMLNMLLVGLGTGYYAATSNASPTGGVVMEFGVGQSVVEDCIERIIPVAIGGEFSLNHERAKELGTEAEFAWPDCFESGVCYVDESMESQIIYQSVRNCTRRTL